MKDREKVVKVDEKNVRGKGHKSEKKLGSKKEEKKTMWEKFMTFCHGVVNEFKKVRWTSRKDMIKYSIATIVFIVFCSVFFYGIDTIFAFIQSLFS